MAGGWATSERGRQRSVRRLAVVAVMVLATGCTDGGDGGDGSGADATADTTAATATTTVGGASTTTAVGTTTAPPDGAVTIRGTVASVSASARLLQLEEPVDGYATVVLAGDTVIRTADGAGGSLQDLEAGSVVDVEGQPGAEGSLIASTVTLVG